MTTLKQLIDQLCPDGVEYVRLGDVAEIKTGQQVSKQAIANNPGEFPVINSGKEPLGFIDTFNSEDPIGVTTRGAGVGFVSWTPGKHFKGALNYSLRVHDNLVSDRFLYYALLESRDEIEKRCSFAGIPALNRSQLITVPIPLPPREVQDKIVEYLDAFAALCGNLDIEIAQREQQFAEYREKLLSRPDLVESTLTLGEFLEMRAGRSIKAAEISAEPTLERNTPCVGGNGLRGYVDSMSHSGDFAVVGRQGALCGNVNWVSGDFYATEHAVVVTPNENLTAARYTYHLLTLMDLNQYATKSAQPGLAVSTLKNLSVGLPSLETQQEIADKLDAMQAVIDNLRLEREQRQQQFDYYCEKLLAFTAKDTAEV